jgi:hypothetical protein
MQSKLLRSVVWKVVILGRHHWKTDSSSVYRVMKMQWTRYFIGVLWATSGAWLIPAQILAMQLAM